ncbi:hypothetical protein D3C80_1266440 [compost metagenome]
MNNLEDGFYLTHPTASSAINTRVVEVADNQVQVVNGTGRLWFPVAAFFNINTLIRQLTEDEADAL